MPGGEAGQRWAIIFPEKPEDYNLDFGDGRVIGEEDKPIIEGFLQSAHERNMRPDEVKANIEWYYGEVERQADEFITQRNV